MTSESIYSNPADIEGIGESPENAGPEDRPEAGPVERKFGDRTVLHGTRPLSGQVQAIISQLALRQIEGHGSSDLERELGGVLLGKATQSGSNNMVNIQAAIPVISGDHGPVHFTFTADSWAQLHQDRQERYPQLDVVGWYHTHPDLGVFFSADDIVVHSAAFVLPWQVGLVYDPIRSEVCLVGWRQKHNSSMEKELASLSGFYEKLDYQDQSVVSWHFTTASVWRQGGYLPDDTVRNRAVYSPSPDWPSLPIISPWWGVVLGGLSLLISLLLLIDRLLGGV